MEDNKNVVVKAATSSLKKKVLIGLVSVLVVVVVAMTSVMATVAYFTASAAVTNSFTIGQVVMSLDEAHVNLDGTLHTDGTRVNGNTYKLVPNTTYTKDPTIHITGNSELSYLFIIVRNDIEAAEDKSGATKTIAQQLFDNGWAKYKKAATGWVYVYVGAGNVPEGDVAKTEVTTFTAAPVAVGDGNYNLISNFTIGEDANVSNLGMAKVIFSAVAIQKKGFEEIDKAWAAVIETYPTIHMNSGN